MPCGKQGAIDRQGVVDSRRKLALWRQPVIDADDPAGCEPGELGREGPRGSRISKDISTTMQVNEGARLVRAVRRDPFDRYTAEFRRLDRDAVGQDEGGGEPVALCAALHKRSVGTTDESGQHFADVIDRSIAQARIPHLRRVADAKQLWLHKNQNRVAT